MKDPSEDPEAFWALFADELNDPNALSLEEVQRAMPVHGDTRETMIARNNRNNPKRLTGPELAAEYWHLELELQQAMTQELAASIDKRKKATKHWQERIGILMKRWFAMRNFATLPNYDEVPE